MRRHLLVLCCLALVATGTMGFTWPSVPGAQHLVDTVTVADVPLAADAGSSVLVAPGDHAVLLGTAFGGSGKYTFAWSFPTDESRVEDPTNPTGAIETTDLAAGTYDAVLTVTDTAGTSATDTVRFVVAGGDAGAEEVLFQETVADMEPGTTAANSQLNFPLDVPAGLAQLEVVIEWSVVTNDYDLHLIDPAGAVRGSSGNAPPEAREAVGVANPEPGEWTIFVERWATVAEPALTVTATGRQAADDAGLPTVSTGGPYAFADGASQVLADATATAGGAAFTSVGWDTTLDGRIDTPGANPTLDLAPGRHLVTLRATDADGFEVRQMTSVLVGTADEVRAMTVPFTVIAVADTGINPYHAEFSAATYPDPEVLELTRNFTRHPSEYIPGYPADSQALPATTGDEYFPAKDTYLWDGNHYIDAGRLYWIPGTKIIGAFDAGGSTGATSGDDPHPILDDHGHGTGSASVSTGNRYGYCPTCLLMVVEGLNETIATGYSWIDISSNSFGAIGGIPLGLLLGPDEPTKQAAERGQLTLFSAGNGTANAFATTPILTYGSRPNGADWVLSIGATREDNQGAIISDGYPTHISALGDGDLPSACRTGTTGQCAFGGTSAASPYTAGAFGHILTEVRRALGDTAAGQREVVRPDGSVQRQVVAHGTPIPGSPFLSDGILTREELRTVGLKTAVPRGQGQEIDTDYPFPWTYTGDQSVMFEGYGSAGPAHAARAIEVLLGREELPARPVEDDFFAQDCDYRDSLYGGYDRTGDGEADGCDESGVNTMVGSADATNHDPRVGRYADSRSAVSAGPVLTDPITYFLHREVRHEPTRDDVDECAENMNEQFMSRVDTTTDVEGCFDGRITSTVAAFRPKGIFTATDHLDGALPAGSTVSATIYMQSLEPTISGLELVLKATDREVGRSARVSQPTNPVTWTAFDLELTTALPVAPGEQLTVHLVHIGAPDWSYGYNGDAASQLTITPASPTGGLEFGVVIDDVSPPASPVTVSGRVSFPELGEDPQLAGFHPQTLVVQVAVNDPGFLRPTYAMVDPTTGDWTARVKAQSGDNIQVRALRDRFASVGTTAVVPGATAEEPATATLPATGGGLALIALGLLGLAAVPGRRR